MRILVCGGREYTDWDAFNDALYWICSKIGDGAKETTIISGKARGADSLAIRFAHEYGTNLECYPADWESYGKAAGFIRNQQMLDDGKPDRVVAFPGGRGTADMIRRSHKAGVEVTVVGEDN